MTSSLHDRGERGYGRERKVLFTASTWSHIMNFHLPYLRYFQEQGWRVHIACAGAPTRTPYADRALDLPFRKRIHAPENFQAARILRREIEQAQYDLITTHTSLAAFFTRFALRRMGDRPAVVSVVHGYLFDDETPLVKRNLLLTAERLTAPQTDLLLTMNRWDFRLAKRFQLGAHVEKIPGIGVDFSRLDEVTPTAGSALRKEYGVPPHAYVLIYAAEFSRRKSQEVLIRAIQRLPEEVVLVLAGDGAIREECQALAERSELGGRIIFPGHISRIAPWYQMANAAVSASRSEGLPFNIMEAMYAGLPVVASAVKGHTDLIEHGVTGLLYPYGDADACAGQLQRLLESPALGADLAKNAKENVARYSLEQVFPAVIEQYESLVGEPVHAAGVL